MFLRLVVGFLCVTHALVACTGLRLTARNGEAINGRTVEFGTKIDMYAAVIPRGYSFVGKTPQGRGLPYTSKYAAAGIYCFDDQVLMDGINEKGLSAAAFYFPGYADYGKVTRANQSHALSPVEFANWILTQFATIDEVKAALPGVLIAPTVIKAWGPTPAPFHYVVYDKSGKSIVIEPTGGELVVHENPLGVITNSPTFDWQMTNLVNFINLSPFNVPPLEIDGVELTAFGQGSGMVGLPGDFTPTSRFVRAAIFSHAAVPSKSAAHAVDQAFHILNQFDIPYGVVRQREGASIGYDYTMLTSVKDPQAMKYYFRSYGDQTIRLIDLSQFDLQARSIRSVTTATQQVDIDISKTMN